MKQLYTLVLLLSLGTIAIVVANPKIVNAVIAKLKERQAAGNRIQNEHFPAAPTWDGNEIAPAAPATFGGQLGSSTPPTWLARNTAAQNHHVAPQISAPAPMIAMMPMSREEINFPSTPIPTAATTEIAATESFASGEFSPFVADSLATETMRAQSSPTASPIEIIPSVIVPIPINSPEKAAPVFAESAPSVGSFWDSPPQNFAQHSAAQNSYATPANSLSANSIWGNDLPPIQSAPNSSALSSPSNSSNNSSQSFVDAPRSARVPSTSLLSTAPQSISSDGAALTPAIFSEVVNVQGADTVARIGTHVVLLCDILPQAKREAQETWDERITEVPEDQRASIALEQRETFIKQFMMMKYQALLQEQIQIALLYNDFASSRRRDEVEAQEKRVHTVFDQEEIPNLMKELNVENVAALKLKLKNEYGGSLDRERMLYTRKMIAFGWLNANVADVDNKCTHDEMFEYYQQNLSTFEHQAKVRWQELFVSRASQDREAWNKIAWMGNQVSAGATFEEIAKTHSQGMKSADGGVWDWMTRGNLASQTLEDYLFTAPVKQLSPIIETPQGYYIVRVIDREEKSHTPFVEAQVTIRDKIKNERRQSRNEEYFTLLQKRYPIEVVKDTLNLQTPPSLITRSNDERRK